MPMTLKSFKKGQDSNVPSTELLYLALAEALWGRVIYKYGNIRRYNYSLHGNNIHIN